MATLAYTSTTSRFLLVALVMSVVTGLGMQKFSPALVLVLFVLPYLIVLFHYYPLLLTSLWLVLLFLSIVFPDTMYEFGAFYFIPMDPAYFFSIIFLTLYALTQRNECLRVLKANPFLAMFLGIVLLHILIYMPLHGKSSLGEARKFYFFFFFPLLAFLSIKTFNDLRTLLLLIFFLALAFLMTSLFRLIMGSSTRGLANAQMALFFLFTTFSILMFHINGRVILNPIVDIIVLGLCLTMITLTQHRSVLVAAAFGLVLMYVLSRNKILFISKMSFALITIFAVIGLILSSVPAFERLTIERLSGIINPQSDNTASWRMKGWSHQMDKLLASSKDLLFGQGLGSYYRAFNEGVQRAKNMNDPHNAYFQTITNFGLLGLVIYGLLAFMFFWKIFALRRTLPRGPMRAYVEMSVLNFGAGHAFMMGYGFSLPILIFLGMGMSAIKLLEDFSEVGEQDEQCKCYNENA
jgi:hypothetical protein